MIGLDEICNAYHMNWSYLLDKTKQMFGKKYVLTNDEYIILICSFINRDNRVLDITIPIVKRLFGDNWKIIIDNLRRNDLPTKYAKKWLSDYAEDAQVTSTITAIYLNGRYLNIKVYDTLTYDDWTFKFRVYKNNWQNNWYGLKQLEKWLQQNTNQKNIKLSYGKSNVSLCYALERVLLNKWKLGIVK